MLNKTLEKSHLYFFSPRVFTFSFKRIEEIYSTMLTFQLEMSILIPSCMLDLRLLVLHLPSDFLKLKQAPTNMSRNELILRGNNEVR